MREPPAGAAHGHIAATIATALRSFVREHRLGRVFAAETRFILAEDPPTGRGPDAAFVATSRIPPEGIPKGFWPGAPDLAVEVVSPSNTVQQFRDKVADYLAAGTRLVWVIEPGSRSVAIHRPGHPTVVSTTTDVLDGENVLPGFRLPVRELFGL